jgi:hypothetical protein
VGASIFGYFKRAPISAPKVMWLVPDFGGRYGKEIILKAPYLQGFEDFLGFSKI